MMNIGNQIKKLRMEKGVKQEELAEYLHISKQAVSKWETCASTPDIELLPQIAVYFGVSIDELFAFPEEDEFERIENSFFSQREFSPERFDRMKRFLEAQMENRKHQVRAYECMAYLYNHRAASDHERAAKYAKRVLELNPQSKSGWVAYLEAKGGLTGDEWYDNHFEVIEYFKEFLRRNPGNFRGLYAVIENMIADARYDEAHEYVEILGETRSNSQYLRYLGDIALGKGRREEALHLWNQSVEAYPDEWQAYCARADRLKKLGLEGEAIRDYEKCVAMQQPPRIVDGLYSLAQLHEKRGEYEAAIRANERILECLKADYEITEGEQADSRRREIQRLSKLI